MIPEFDPIGDLPAGVHWATWPEIVARFGQNSRRQNLLAGLKQALDALRIAGCETAYIDGSFITQKLMPRDFDGCWEVKNVDPMRLDPVLLMFDAGRIAQKTKYGGELFPAESTEGVSGLMFLEFFQINKDTGTPKGIIALDLRRLP
jgi:hypothetical protein